jgi:nitronate monooxygenase
MLATLGLTLPIIQAPMAGVSTPALAAEVSQAGGLGSLGLGASDPTAARTQIEALQALTTRPVNLNVFVHDPARPDPAREQTWIEALRPTFALFDATPPASLREVYCSFDDDPEMLRLLLEKKPAVVSFHFGVPSAVAVQALKAAGVFLCASATSLHEAQTLEKAGMDAVVAQGIEAGGHRGVFDPLAPDAALGTFALTRLLVKTLAVPVIAAGGIMDGAGIAAALDLGAAAAQLGTAFIGCPESAADAGYRQALQGEGAYQTQLTRLISGRPARALANRFTALESTLHGVSLPDYPIAYDAGKALHAAAKAQGENGFGAHWAGQGAPMARAMPAAALMALLVQELQACRSVAG